MTRKKVRGASPRLFRLLHDLRGGFALRVRAVVACAAVVGAGTKPLVKIQVCVLLAAGCTSTQSSPPPIDDSSAMMCHTSRAHTSSQ